MKEIIKTLLENFVASKGADLSYPEPQQKGDQFLELAFKYFKGQGYYLNVTRCEDLGEGMVSMLLCDKVSFSYMIAPAPNRNTEKQRLIALEKVLGLADDETFVENFTKAFEAITGA